MNRPPLLNQLTVSDPQARTDCGETVVSIILQGHGIMDTPAEEISDLGRDGVTSASDLSGLLIGEQAIVQAGKVTDVLNNLSNSYGLLLIRDNSNADPSPTGNFYHWIVAYENQGFIKCVNPWGGRDVSYLQSILVQSTVWAASVFWPAPVPPIVGDTVWLDRGIKLLPNSTDGYQLDGWGGLHPVGNMPPVRATGYWPNWNIARDFDIKEDGSIGIVVDGFGGLHPFLARGSEMPPYPTGFSYWKNWDIVKQVVVHDWTTMSGYTIDGFGGKHPFGNAPVLSGGAYFRNNTV